MIEWFKRVFRIGAYKRLQSEHRELLDDYGRLQAKADKLMGEVIQMGRNHNDCLSCRYFPGSPECKLRCDAARRKGSPCWEYYGSTI